MLPHTGSDDYFLKIKRVYTRYPDMVPLLRENDFTAADGSPQAAPAGRAAGPVIDDLSVGAQDLAASG